MLILNPKVEKDHQKQKFKVAIRLVDVVDHEVGTVQEGIDDLGAEVDDAKIGLVVAIVQGLLADQDQKDINFLEVQIGESIEGEFLPVQMNEITIMNHER